MLVPACAAVLEATDARFDEELARIALLAGDPSAADDAEAEAEGFEEEGVGMTEV